MTARLRGLAALIGLAAIIIGMPALLIASAGIGTLSIEPTAEGIWQALTTPDNGTIALLLFRAVGWVAWAILTVAVALEVAALIRRTPAPQLRGLALPQHLARNLVATAAALFMATSTLTFTGANESPVAHAAGNHSQPGHAPAGGQQHAKSGGGSGKARTYTVRKGDTLSEIALEQTGHAGNYPKLFRASRDTVQPGGQRLTDPDVIDIGWKITIPGKADTPKAKPKPTSEQPSTTPTVSIPDDQQPTPTSASAAAPVTPSPVATASEPTAVTSPADVASDDQATPGWVLQGLTGAGALLAGALWIGLARRRADQFRRRRPGRTITVPPPHLAAVEKTFIREGSPTGSLIIKIDEILRRTVATLTVADGPVPVLAGLDALPDQLTLRFCSAADLPAPWACVDPDSRQVWRIATDTEPDSIGALADDSAPPWPQLVTLGRDTHGWRLVNLEALGVVTLTGDPDYCHDLARYLVTELALAPWARDVDIDCLGICEELPGLAPDRIHHHTDTAVIDTVIAAAVHTADRLQAAESPSLETARVTYADDDLWDSHLLISSTTQADHLNVLTDLINHQPGRTATALLLIRPDSHAIGTELKLTDTGRIQIPTLALDLVVTGLTRDEARGCVAVMTTGQTDPDTEMPDADNEQEWARFCDDAGALKGEYTSPRDETGPNPNSVLPEPDQVYVGETSNTEQDLAKLAPQVDADVRGEIEAADPTLDDDLEQWWAETCDRPRLQILGPIRVRLGRTGVASAATNRVPFCYEAVAYLSTRPDGVTTTQLADALRISEGRVRKDMSIVRAWLGTNPATGHHFLPGATKTEQSGRRGIGLYLIEDLLSDADLFKRLRLRGESRGPAGIDDLRQALRLVNGTPLDQLRDRGGLWLIDNPLDQHLICGIVDVAHIVTTSALEAGDLEVAQAAAELAALAAPHEDTPQLDMVAVAAKAGRMAEAAGIARVVTSRRNAHDGGPLDLSQRTDTIMRSHRWLGKASRAS